MPFGVYRSKVSRPAIEEIVVLFPSRGDCLPEEIVGGFSRQVTPEHDDNFPLKSAFVLNYEIVRVVYDYANQ